jgi:hypothetical protein
MLEARRYVSYRLAFSRANSFSRGAAQIPIRTDWYFLGL